MKAGNPPCGLPAFYYIHFFSRRNPSLPYGCTATKRIFDDSAHFYLSRNAKKAQTEKVKRKCFYRTKTFMKAKIFTNIDFNEGRQSARGLPAFYHIHFFSRRNPSLPYGCTATKRIFDDSAHFYLFRNAKKVQTEKVKG